MLLCFCFLVHECYLPWLAGSTDSICSLYQGGDSLNSSTTLVSKNGLFTLGFTRLGSAESNVSYLGIWYTNDMSHPFWLANRDKSIADNSGVLGIDGSGNMKLTYSGGDLVDFYSSRSSTTNLTAVLEDSGNVVLKDANSNQILWQSFDHPTDKTKMRYGMRLGKEICNLQGRMNKRQSNGVMLEMMTSKMTIDLNVFSSLMKNRVVSNLNRTLVVTIHRNKYYLTVFLLGMKLGINRRTGQSWYLTSWLSNMVPASGAFTFEWEPNGQQLVIELRGELFWTSGSLRRLVYSFLNVSKADEDYFTFTADKLDIFSTQEDEMIFSRWNLSSDGGIIGNIMEAYLEAQPFLHDLMTMDTTNDIYELENDGNKGHNLKVYSAAKIMASTSNFASENKLGQGGFGLVYKGKLPEGREIAVKRLSRSSGQGLVEFKNELILIAKLQHMNLVRLLGCCIQGEEKMLVYVYMPNKSLNLFIFVLRSRIIHRDLKAGNILLDENLNPKISDFGMARIFKINDLQANTNQIVGTRGYMSPEYVMEGIFSVYNVFSFGVLLEIVSGRRIQGLLEIDGHPLILAWELWKAGTSFEMMDPILRESCFKDQVLRCINVGLLCVEDTAIDRPTMSDVVSMLTSEAQLPLPKQRAFSNPRTAIDDAAMSLRNPESSSRNYLSTSIMYGR
ncbi:hypothetical protein POPTR_001G441040v4 [Populus trichocarpa]|uniref:Disease resistance protein At4g27190-like leucine-rich repeats domain-containing protein n=1 Tax=Populus trichocarpa TaxID=3694 RepID=A0A2K2CCT2_POPTR|nr:hypothetical protein POPTR_001G441040v4 [Populus trichocarpa]